MEQDSQRIRGKRWTVVVDLEGDVLTGAVIRSLPSSFTDEADTCGDTLGSIS